MAQKKNAEVIIVGAGPSGLSCAKALADSGIETLIIEKEINPGSKNFYSTVILKESIENYFGEYNSKVERELFEFKAYFLREDTFLSVCWSTFQIVPMSNM